MRAARVIAWLVAVPLYVWSAAALALFPTWAPPVRWVALGLLLGAGAWTIRRVSAPRRAASILAAGLTVLALWQTVRPDGQRPWAVGQERLPIVRFDGPRVEIENVRSARWQSPGEADVRWETRRYDLRDLRTVDLVLEPFGEWRGLAHVFVTFGFANGEHLGVSIESRRERDEIYSPLRGAFRAYELLYVVGDERDLIGLRANVRRHPVYVFPMRAAPDDVQALLVSMLTRADRLGRDPAFYNTVTSTCATELLRHVNAVRDRDISPLDWRMAIPGYADELAWELGLVDHAGTMEEARQRFLINARSAGHDRMSGPDWSRQIRGGSSVP